MLEERLTFEEIEQKLGIDRSHRDFPNNRYYGDNYPISSYYYQFRPSFPETHRRADKALARLAKLITYLRQLPLF